MEPTLLLSQIIAEKDDLSVFFGDVPSFLEFCAELYAQRGQVLSEDELTYLNAQAKKISDRSGDNIFLMWKADDIRREAARLGLIEVS